MQMWAGHAPRCTHFADFVASLNKLPGFDINAMQVGIKRHQSLAMINENTVSAKKIVACFHNLPGCWCVDGCACWGGNIQSAMGFPSLVVKKTASLL